MKSYSSIVCSGPMLGGLGSIYIPGINRFYDTPSYMGVSCQRYSIKSAADCWLMQYVLVLLQCRDVVYIIVADKHQRVIVKKRKY